MSFLGKILGKKKDDLGLDSLDNTFPGTGPTPGLDQPMQSPERPYPSQQYPSSYPGQQMPGEPQQTSASFQHRGGPSPEDLGFERVNEKENYNPALSRQQSMGDINNINLGKDIEIISAKLDSIKAELDSMNQRLKRLERIAQGESAIHKDKWEY